MFDIVGHRNWMINQLYAFTQILFVPNNGPRPEKPFVAYTIIAPYIPQEAPPVIQYSDIVKPIEPEPSEPEPIEPESSDPDQPEVVTENWSRKQRIEYPTVVWSFTAVSTDASQCYETIMQIRQWFELNGKDALQGENIVVARVEPVLDRSLIIEEIQPEYRVGFDVALRVSSKISIDVETIESVDYTTGSNI